MRFGERLRTVRKARRLTQEELGQILGFSRGTMSKYETGFLEPNLETLVKIARFFNVSVDYLVGVKSERNKLKSDAYRYYALIDELPDDAKRSLYNFLDTLASSRNKEGGSKRK